MQYTIYTTKGYLGDMVGEFPDLPGCCPEGDDLEELLANIQPAVEAWVAENGLTALPEPSDAMPDLSDPRRMPLLVEVDESFLSAEAPEQDEQAAEA